MGGKRERAQPAETATASAGDIETPTEPPSKKSRVEASRSLFVRSLAPTATPESLTEFFSQHFPVKHAHVITDPKTKESRGYGFVTFTDADDAKEAKEKLNKHKLDGRAMLLEIAEARHRKAGEAQTEAVAKKEQRQAELAEARKAPKLIIRNLPWSIKKGEQLGALFQGFGKVKFADLPSNKGKLSGFGFITMRGHKNAEKAMEMLNGKTIDGRTIAVDWAVDKNQWQKQNAEDDEDKEDKEDNKADKKSKKKSKAQKTSEEEEEDENNDIDDGGEPKNPDDQLDADLRNFFKNHMGNMEDEDSKDENEDEDDDDNEDEDENEKDSAPQKKFTTDNSTTLFVRNLPFSTTDVDLKSHFEQFGTIRYARIVMDRTADRPAGTGFVCFANPDEFKDCLRGAPRITPSTTAGKKMSILQDERKDPEGKYTIDGRVLQISQAVSKDEATRLADEGVAARGGKDRDKRRLYLLAEGQIPHDSPLHRLLTPSEVQIRDQSAAQRKKLIQGNPSLHLSLTRLAVRNLPRETDSKALKQLAREAVVGFATDVKEGKRSPLNKEELTRCEDDRAADQHRREQGKGVVKQTKIIYENAQGSKVEEIDGASKSRGYGFIEYHTHRAALMGLRWLNGHALKNKAGKAQRLIVEFAIENANVVARRRDLQSKFSAGSGGGAGGHRNGNFRKDDRDGKKGGLPKGKDFAVSNKKGKKGSKDKGKSGDDNKPVTESAANGSKKGKEQTKKEDFQQQIIGRKRMMRKKKAQSRG